jgi:hypothetical protein
MSNTEPNILWSEVMKACRPYRLRLESQLMFRDPKVVRYRVKELRTDQSRLRFASL